MTLSSKLCISLAALVLTANGAFAGLERGVTHDNDRTATGGKTTPNTIGPGHIYVDGCTNGQSTESRVHPKVRHWDQNAVQPCPNGQGNQPAGMKGDITRNTAQPH